jgi:dynein heavy chain
VLFCDFVGIDGNSVTFLLADTQIVNEGFVEDVNNLLNSGEVPGLHTSDEKDRVMADIRDYVLALGLPLTKEQLYTSFINRSRENIHVVLCMSPIGDAFRGRCRQFPSLINCTTIDWFNEWPEEALLSVSAFFLSSVDLGSQEVSMKAILNQIYNI